ncbi:MAG TPA: biotin/lipoyl-containing protein [Pyrinomonadaceae bacterium]|jgi:biotin carboxyl carrier protein
MKLTAEVAGQEHALELQREGASVVAEVDGRRYELEAREVEPGSYLLHAAGRVYECRVRRTDGAAGASEVHVGQQVFQITLVDPKRLRHMQSAGAQTGGRAAVVAAMPGKVVRVLVAVGAQVEAGAALLVVEAMKMQNELKSSKDGTVVELQAATGATVNAGDVLAVVE